MKPTADNRRLTCWNTFIKLFCISLLTLNATGQDINFTRVPLPDNFTDLGPASEDPQGYMWFSSLNGIHRFDGYHYVSWLNDPLDSNSLCNNHVESIYAARDNTIWLGTQTSGMD